MTARWRSRIRAWIKGIPVIGEGLRRLYWWIRRRREGPGAGFQGSREYWEERYAAGGDSGAGSYEKLAAFKAEVLNGFVAEQGVRSVIELGCGDGSQLALAAYPRYLGLDVSETALALCRERFAGDPTKTFMSTKEYAGETAELALSLDVVYHLVEDEVFEDYMRTLFDAATRFVIVYASDRDDDSGREGPHIRHRKFTRWVERHRPEWKLLRRIPNRYPYRGDPRTGSFADFFIYGR